MPNALIEEEDLANLLKVTGFKTLNALIVNSVRYAYLHGKKHHVGAEWAQQPLNEQDAIDDEVVRAFRSGESLAGSYFEHLVRECVEELALKIEEPEHKVAVIMARRLAARKK